MRSHCIHGHILTPENIYTYPNGKKTRCQECHRCQNKVWNKTHLKKYKVYQQKWYKKNFEKRNAQIRAWQKNNPEKRAAIQRKHCYGLTSEMFDMMLANQNNRCICGMIFGSERTVQACVDHEHAGCTLVKSCGKCVRGLLCRRCNIVLGHYERRGDLHNLPPYLKQYLHRWNH